MDGIELLWKRAKDDDADKFVLAASENGCLQTGDMAPEYASSGKLTDRSDVFSFGVVLLELVTGRRPVEAIQNESLVEWVSTCILFQEPLTCCYFCPRNTSQSFKILLCTLNKLNFCPGGCFLQARPLIASAIETGDFSELADPRLGKRYIGRDV
ncbi:hypothetical protein MKW92_008681 [Papaver armeniacum]|nr:hypothetical protein MKW92_008681 [Papaver armeniacum]